jgi:uncharacterized protein (DUF1501 family)
MMTRRIFMKNGSLALVSLGFTPAFIARSAEAAQARQKILIAIFQRGAVDGLNMIVPFGDKSYYSVRQSIAIPKPGEMRANNEGAIDLDGFFGMHPRMAALQPHFKRGELAIVHASGSHDDTRSHFDAQDYMESGTPGIKSTRDGWLNRYLHAKDHAERSSPFRAVAIAQALPRSLQGIAPALAIGQLGQFGIRAGNDGGMMAAGFEAQYSKAADQLLGTTGREAFDAVKMIQNANPQGYTPSNGAEYPRSGFGEALRQIAQVVKADLGLEVAFAEVGGWDDHRAEGASNGQLANRLFDFSNGLAAFAQDLGDRMADVVVITMSEFGRTVSENGSGGTDHGHGNAMMILGGNVKGGKVYGQWPGLSRDKLYQGRDLAITTDFRDVFAECVTSHLGAKDISKVFPGYTYKQKLGFIKT